MNKFTLYFYTGLSRLQLCILAMKIMCFLILNVYLFLWKWQMHSENYLHVNICKTLAATSESRKFTLSQLFRWKEILVFTWK